MHNLPACFVSEIGVKVKFATHEEWWQNLRNGFLPTLLIRHFNLVMLTA